MKIFLVAITKCNLILSSAEAKLRRVSKDAARQCCGRSGGATRIPPFVFMKTRGSPNYARSETGAEPAGLDGGARQALYLERREGRAPVQDDPARAPRNDRAVAAVDDDRPQIGREVHLPAVLRRHRQRQLHRRRLEGRRAAASRLVSQPRRQPRGRGAGRHEENKGAGPHRDRCRAREIVAGGAEVLAALRRLSEKDRTRDP